MKKIIFTNYDSLQKMINFIDEIIYLINESNREHIGFCKSYLISVEVIK